MPVKSSWAIGLSVGFVSMVDMLKDWISDVGDYLGVLSVIFIFFLLIWLDLLIYIRIALPVILKDRF